MILQYYILSDYFAFNMGGGSDVSMGCYSAKGRGRLIRVKERMNGAVYRQSLSKNLFPLAEAPKRTRGWVFQHDNDAKDAALATKEWLGEVLEWPNQSPDIETIKTLWRVLTTRTHLCSRGDVRGRMGQNSE